VLQLPWAVVPMTLNAFGIALVFPILTLAVLDMYPRQRGSASSLQAFTALVSNALIAGVVSPWLSGNGLWLAVAAGLFTAAGWAFWRWEAVVAANGKGRGRSAAPRVPDSPEAAGDALAGRRFSDRRGGRDPACQGFDEARAGAGVTDDTATAIAPAVPRRRGNPLQQLGAGANQADRHAVQIGAGGECNRRAVVAQPMEVAVGHNHGVVIQRRARVEGAVRHQGRTARGFDRAEGRRDQFDVGTAAAHARQQRLDLAGIDAWCDGHGQRPAAKVRRAGRRGEGLRLRGNGGR